jgi:hypothetical protein
MNFYLGLVSGVLSATLLLATWFHFPEEWVALLIVEFIASIVVGTLFTDI